MTNLTVVVQLGASQETINTRIPWVGMEKTLGRSRHEIRLIWVCPLLCRRLFACEVLVPDDFCFMLTGCFGP